MMAGTATRTPIRRAAAAALVLLVQMDLVAWVEMAALVLQTKLLVHP
jgi:hypothetical protein